MALVRFVVGLWFALCADAVRKLLLLSVHLRKFGLGQSAAGFLDRLRGRRAVALLRRALEDLLAFLRFDFAQLADGMVGRAGEQLLGRFVVE